MITCPECETIHFSDKILFCTECGLVFEKATIEE